MRRNAFSLLLMLMGLVSLFIISNLLFPKERGCGVGEVFVADDAAEAAVWIEGGEFINGVVGAPAAFVALEFDGFFVPVVGDFDLVFGDHADFDLLLDGHAVWLVGGADGLLAVEALLQRGGGPHGGGSYEVHKNGEV